MLTYAALAAARRSGARAASQGSCWQANPYLLAANMPAATGESIDEWCKRHDAWQAGHQEESGHGAARPHPRWTATWRSSE